MFLLAVVMAIQSYTFLGVDSAGPIVRPVSEEIQITDCVVDWKVSPINPQIVSFLPDISSDKEWYLTDSGSRIAVPGNIKVFGNEIRFDRRVRQDYVRRQKWFDDSVTETKGTDVYGLSLWVTPKLLTREESVHIFGTENLKPEYKNRLYGFGFEAGVGIFNGSDGLGRFGIAAGFDDIGRRSDTWIALEPEVRYGPVFLGWESGYAWVNGGPNTLFSGWKIGFHVW